MLCWIAPRTLLCNVLNGSSGRKAPILGFYRPMEKWKKMFRKFCRSFTNIHRCWLLVGVTECRLFHTKHVKKSHEKITWSKQLKFQARHLMCASFAFRFLYLSLSADLMTGIVIYTHCLCMQKFMNDWDRQISYGQSRRVWMSFSDTMWWNIVDIL